MQASSRATIAACDKQGSFLANRAFDALNRCVTQTRSNGVLPLANSHNSMRHACACLSAFIHLIIVVPLVPLKYACCVWWKGAVSI